MQVHPAHLKYHLIRSRTIPMDVQIDGAGMKTPLKLSGYGPSAGSAMLIQGKFKKGIENALSKNVIF